MHAPQTTVQTAGWKLFNFYWQVRVPYVHTLDPIETALRGVPTSGNPKWDEASLRQMTLMSLPIVRDEEIHPQIVSLVELYDQGVDIDFVDAATAAKIYDLVGEHLRDVAHQFNTSMFFLASVIEADESKKRLVDDILTLERFANSVFPIVQRTRPLAKVAPNSFIETLNYWRLGKSQPLGTPQERVITSEAPNPFTTALQSDVSKRLKPWMSK